MPASNWKQAQTHLQFQALFCPTESKSKKRSPHEPSWLIDGDYFNPLSENFLISLTITHRAQWVGASEKGTAREGKSHLLFIPRLCDELRFICRIVIIWTFFFLSCSFHSVNFNFNYLLVICIVPGSESRSDVYFSFFFFFFGRAIFDHNWIEWFNFTVGFTFACLTKRQAGAGSWPHFSIIPTPDGGQLGGPRKKGATFFLRWSDCLNGFNLCRDSLECAVGLIVEKSWIYYCEIILQMNTNMIAESYLECVKTTQILL